MDTIEEKPTSSTTGVVFLSVDAKFSEGHVTPYQGAFSGKSAITPAETRSFTFGPSYATSQDTASDEGEAVAGQLLDRLRVALTRLREGRETAAEKFERLVAEWRKKTAHHSMLWKKTGDPNYHRIMGMGERALPFIMAELRRDGAYWFPALEAITEDDPTIPVRTEQEAIDAWLDWGRSRGIIL